MVKKYDTIFVIIILMINILHKRTKKSLSEEILKQTKNHGRQGAQSPPLPACFKPNPWFTILVQVHLQYFKTQMHRIFQFNFLEI